MLFYVIRIKTINKLVYNCQIINRVAEILELSGNETMDEKRKRINVYHVCGKCVDILYKIIRMFID